MSKLDGTLSTITTRLEKLEEGVAVNTAKLNTQPSSLSTLQSTSSSSSCKSSGGCGSRQRKRRSPTGLSVSNQFPCLQVIYQNLMHVYSSLQNLVRTIHNNLPEEKLKKRET